MIDFDKIPEMMEHLKCSNVRLKDLNGNLLYQILDDNLNAATQKLKDLKNTFSSYGRIEMQLANKAMVGQSWKNCYEYQVFFNAAGAVAVQQQQQPGAMMGMGGQGFSVMDIIKLSVENATLKVQAENQNKLPEIPESYFNLAGLIGLGTGSGGGGKLSGKESGTELHLEGTEVEEKIKKIEQVIARMIQKNDIEKVIIIIALLEKILLKQSPEKIIKVLTAAAKNPALIDTIIPFIKK